MDCADDQHKELIKRLSMDIFNLSATTTQIYRTVRFQKSYPRRRILESKIIHINRASKIVYLLRKIWGLSVAVNFVINGLVDVKTLGGPGGREGLTGVLNQSSVALQSALLLRLQLYLVLRALLAELLAPALRPWAVRMVYL